MKTRFKNGDMWVLVEVYLALGGFVAHWFSHGGVHSYEPFVPILNPKDIKNT